MFRRAVVTLFPMMAVLGCSGGDKASSGAGGGAQTTGSDTSGSGAGATTGSAGTGGGQGSLPEPKLVDCTQDANNSQNICKRPDAAFAGTIGKGITIDATVAVGGFPEIRRGFVDTKTNRLIVAVELGTQFDADGIILSVDLATGDREVVSGQYEDPAKGPIIKGMGPDLGYVWDVQPTPQGKLIAMVEKGTQTPPQVLEIDPASGDRTVLPIGTSDMCTGHTGPVGPSFRSFAIDAAGAVYLAIADLPNGAGTGILRYQGADCSVVTLAGAIAEENNKGSGPAIKTGLFQGLHFAADGKLWMVNDLNQDLVSVDVTSGARTRVSSKLAGVGSGDAEIGRTSLALSKDAVFTMGSFAGSDFLLTSVAPDSGNRTELLSKAGPVVFALDSLPGVWTYPGWSTLILKEENAIILYDPATGNSNTFSY